MGKRKQSWSGKPERPGQWGRGAKDKQRRETFGRDGFGKPDKASRPEEIAKAKKKNWGGKKWLRKLFKPKPQGMSLRYYYAQVDRLADHRIQQGVEARLAQMVGRGGKVSELADNRSLANIVQMLTQLSPKKIGALVAKLLGR